MAISFDTTSKQACASTNLTTNLTWSHTCTGSNLVLLVGVATQSGTNINPTSVTYNGTAMTLVTTQANTNPSLQLAVYSLTNPSTGTNTVEVSWSGATVARSGGVGVSLTGVSASPVGANNKNAQATTTPSLAVTTTQDNSFVVSFLEVGDAPVSTATGTNQTKRDDLLVLSNFYINASTQTTTTAGSYTNSWSKSNSSQSAQIVVEVKELVSTGSTQGLMMML